jgi:hypothetical protein
MSRKSALVTLCILGALGVGACCCCSGFLDPDNPNPNPGGHGGGGHVWGRPGGWFFWGGGSSYPVGPVAVGTPHPGGVASSSPRGGFGATGAGHASGSSSSSSGG